MPQAQCRRADAFCAAQLPLCCTSQSGHSCWYIVVRMQKHCFFGLSLYLHAAPFGQIGDGGRRERERERERERDIIHIPWQFPIDINLLNCVVGSAIHGHGVPWAASGIGPGALKCSRCRIGVDGAAASLWRRAFPQGRRRVKATQRKLKNLQNVKKHPGNRKSPAAMGKRIGAAKQELMHLMVRRQDLRKKWQEQQEALDRVNLDVKRRAENVEELRVDVEISGRWWGTWTRRTRSSCTKRLRNPNASNHSLPQWIRTFERRSRRRQNPMQRWWRSYTSARRKSNVPRTRSLKKSSLVRRWRMRKKNYTTPSEAGDHEIERADSWRATEGTKCWQSCSGRAREVSRGAEDQGIERTDEVWLWQPYWLAKMRLWTACGDASTNCNATRKQPNSSWRKRRRRLRSRSKLLKKTWR